jgi:hypothetical protein
MSKLTNAPSLANICLKKSGVSGHNYLIDYFKYLYITNTLEINNRIVSSEALQYHC